MTEMISTAYSELTRVLPWSLRALGYSFPVADRASHVVATAAAIEPQILDAFLDPAQRSASAGAIYEVGANRFEIDASGVSLFEIGPVAMDFAGARTPGAGYLRTMIEGALNVEVLPAVLLIACEYGVEALAVAMDGTDRSWVLASGAPGSRRILRGSGSLPPQLLGMLDDDFADDLRRCFEPGDRKSKCAIFFTRRKLGEISRVASGGEIIEADQMISQSFGRGIRVTPETLQAIYELEKITWAPTSERSRAQAGFQQSTGGAA
jgi:hypothetical protein